MFGAFPLDSHFEVYLQNGSIFWIWRCFCNLSAVCDFGVVLGVSMTFGSTASDCAVVSSNELAEQSYSWC